MLYTNEYGVYVPGVGNDGKRVPNTRGIWFTSTPFTVDGYNVSNPARPFDQPTSMAAIRNIGMINVESIIMITKVDEQTRLPLSGAMFNITPHRNCIEDEENIRYPRGMAPVRLPWQGVTYHTTNDQGLAIFIDKSSSDCINTYTIKEIKAPDGYELDPTPIVFSLIG